jgi:hypothetical protein
MEHHDSDPDMSADTIIEKPVLGSSHADLCSDPAQVKRDSHGFPLVPQPSRFKDDPLVSNISFTNCNCDLLPTDEYPN